MSTAYSDTAEDTYGHAIPPFREVLLRLLAATLGAMSTAELTDVADRLAPRDKEALGDYLGPEGLAQLLEGMPEDKRALFTRQYHANGSRDDDAFRPVYPRVMAVVNNNLPVDRLREVLRTLEAADLASQSLFMGIEGCRIAFRDLNEQTARAILDHTDDWVFLVTARRRYASIERYTATLQKQEGLGRKLQDVETIQLKLQERPKAIYMKWIAGPFKGRELLYNEALLGPGKVRVREAGMLGVLPVTIAVDSPVARRGTNHQATEVGLRHMLHLMERDYVKAAPRGHVRRVSHGIMSRDGRKLYKMESVLPRDPSLGYYCHRMVHYTDYADMLEVGCEIHGHEDELRESFFYEGIDLEPRLTDSDFDPQNREYRLK